MDKPPFEVGRLVAHRTAPDVSWVVCDVHGVTPLVNVRRVAGDKVLDATFGSAELVPYTDDVADLAERLVARVRADDRLSGEVLRAAEMLHDDIADELDD